MKTPDEVRTRIRETIEATRKLGDETDLPEAARLAVETTGEAYLNTFDACFAQGGVEAGAGSTFAQSSH